MKLKLWLIELLIAIDQLCHVLGFAPHYFFFKGELPKADETISSKVGRHAIKRYIWALFLEKCINFVFGLLGDKNHCRKRIEWDEFED